MPVGWAWEYSELGAAICKTLNKHGVPGPPDSQHNLNPSINHPTVLSQRLGTGKGGLRMAPAIDVEDYLQVQPGSLTPLALAAPKAGAVAFLLDARIKSAERIFAHPGVNTVSLALTPAALESFLK